MRAEPDFRLLTHTYTEQYDSSNYDKGLAAYVMRRGHQILDRIATYDNTSSIIEVGAGSGTHLSFVKRPFGSYLLTDQNEEMLVLAREKHAGRPNVTVRQEDASHVSVSDSSYDRLIASHVLEHLPDPHRVLAEWHRVVRPGGTISLILPCDPGLAWRLGRSCGPRARWKGIGIPYDYFQVREHINSIFNLVTLIDYHFNEMTKIWWPLRIAAADCNLLYIAEIKVEK